MKTLNQHELTSISGGEWTWFPSNPQISPRDGEWRWVAPPLGNGGGSASSPPSEDLGLIGQMP
jgi:bacteriocin-like protein